MQVGGLGLSIPGVNIGAIAKHVVDSNPMLSKAAAIVPAAQKLTDPETGIGQLQETLKKVVKEETTKAASIAAADAIAKAGLQIPPLDPSDLSNAAAAASANANGDNSGNDNSSNAGNNNNSEPADNGEDAQEGGSRRYEIVTLSSPIDEPLFVCYQSGKPVYFTNSSRGLNILPLHSDMEARYTVKKTPKKSSKKRKAPTKKASKKKNSRKRR